MGERVASVSNMGLGGFDGVSRRSVGVGGNCFLTTLPVRSRPPPSSDCCATDERPGGDGIGFAESRRNVDMPSFGGVGRSFVRQFGDGAFEFLRPSVLLLLRVSTCSRTDRLLSSPGVTGGLDSVGDGSTGGAGAGLSRLRSNLLDDDSGSIWLSRLSRGFPSPGPLARMRPGEAPMMATLLALRDGEVRGEREGEVRPKGGDAVEAVEGEGALSCFATDSRVATVSRGVRRGEGCCDDTAKGEGPFWCRSVAARPRLLSLLSFVGIVKGDTSHLGDRLTDISAARLSGACVSDFSISVSNTLEERKKKGYHFFFFKKKKRRIPCPFCEDRTSNPDVAGGDALVVDCGRSGSVCSRGVFCPFAAGLSPPSPHNL